MAIAFKHKTEKYSFPASSATESSRPRNDSDATVAAVKKNNKYLAFNFDKHFIYLQ